MEIRAFKIDEDILVGATNLQEPGLGASEEAASKKAFSLVGGDIADYLIEKLMEYRNPDDIKTIKLSIGRMKYPSDLDTLKKALARLLLVVDVFVTSSDVNAETAEIEIKSFGDSRRLVKDMEEFGFIEFEVNEVRDDLVRITVK